MSRKRSAATPAAKPTVLAPTTSSSPHQEPSVTHEESKGRDLEIRKSELEIEKLEQEIEIARQGHVWWRRTFRDVKMSEWLTAGAAIIALLAAFWTGLFNAIRERLSAQADRLAIEKIHLEDQKEKLGAEIASKDVEIANKNRELADLKTRLQPFEQESAALSLLRDMHGKNLIISLSYPPSFEGVRVSIKHDLINWDGKPKSIKSEAVPRALEAANRIRLLNGIRLRELVLTPEDVALASSRQPLHWLALEYAQLDRLSLAQLNTPKSGRKE
jgi:hypothetical protein